MIIPHYTDEENDTQRGSISLRSHSWEVTEPGLTQSGSKPALKYPMYCLY